MLFRGLRPEHKPTLRALACSIIHTCSSADHDFVGSKPNGDPLIRQKRAELSHAEAIDVDSRDVGDLVFHRALKHLDDQTVFPLHSLPLLARWQRQTVSPLF